MRRISILLFQIVLIIVVASDIEAGTISIFDFGIKEAKTDVDRYNALYLAHCYAVENNCGITYEGVKELSIEIPNRASSIPLPSYVDFAGILITVRNNYKDFYLFTSKQQLQEIDVPKKNIDRGRFRGIKQLRKGQNILILEDQNPWVKNRRNYNYGATRKDILLIENGSAINQIIKEYNNKYSNPKCYYCNIDHDSLSINNVTIKRTIDSKQKTYCFQISGHNNVTLNNISIITPTSDLTGDRAICIENSTNVFVNDVVIKGTYSQLDKFGYGITMDNVWNSCFRRLKANGNWGVFGTHNINYFRIEDSSINRFDIHCYGKDIYSKNTDFLDLYNQFSSLYGTLSFENCRFERFLPILIESSYYAYTYFHVIMNDCVIKVDKNRPYLVRVGIPTPPDVIREELKTLCLPNVTIENTKIILPEGVNTWSIFNMGAIPMPQLDGIDLIRLSNVHVSGGTNSNRIILSNRQFSTRKRISIIVKESNIELIR